MQVLHDHQRVSVDAVRHVHGDGAIRDVAMVLFGDKAGARKQLGLALKKLKSPDGPEPRDKLCLLDLWQHFSCLCCLFGHLHRLLE
jgi:hypothetical protein